jgi:endogenous inhibitor of DNA gyrase (YacG/DUF329 family)
MDDNGYKCIMCGDALPEDTQADGYPFCSPECEENFEEMECE